VSGVCASYTSLASASNLFCEKRDNNLLGLLLFLVESDNQLQMQSQLCLLGKKKSSGRGITGFQVLFFLFLPFLHQLSSVVFSKDRSIFFCS
jgi:hypothetical protein